MLQCVQTVKNCGRLEQDEKMVMRFVIGQTKEAAKEAEILSESRQYGGFLRLSHQVCQSACYTPFP